MNALKPLLFISYARADRVLADRIAQTLERAGCRVWLDRNDILFGDDFVLGLQTNLARCDGLVCLLTHSSADSSWCQAEVQRALARAIPVLVVERDPDARFPDAVERLLRDVQRARWDGGHVPELGDAIRRARARRRSHVLRRAGAIASIALFLLAVAGFVLWNLNDVQIARQRAAVLERIQTSQAFWSRAELDAILMPARDDAELPPRLQGLADDATQSTAARHNAWQALASLREQRQREWRASVPEVDWSGGRIADVLWANVAYQRGQIEDLRVVRTRIAGISLGKGPTDGTPGLTLSNVRIERSDLWFFLVNGTQLLDVEFLDSKFRGSELDLSGYAGVRFRSSPPDPNFITPNLTIIENSVVAQRRPLPGPDVMDLSTPEQEILFDGVHFVGTRFEGSFKPEWFRGSFFTNCVLPAALSADALTKAGNTVEP